MTETSSPFTGQMLVHDDVNQKETHIETNSNVDIIETRNKSSIIQTVVQIAVSIVCGFIFGLSLEKTRVFEPQSIRLQMVMERWIMLKMFLAAVATGQFCLSVLSVLPMTRIKFENASAEFVKAFTEKGILTSILGPFILGAGMTLAGACPGMVLAQVGTWAPNAIFTLVGALISALFYGFVAPVVVRFTKPKIPFQFQQVHKKFNRPYIIYALPMAILLGVTVVLMEYFIPYKNDLNDPDKLSWNVATTIAWPPYVGGIMIGLLQIPVVLVLGDTIGSSTSYVTIVSQWVCSKNAQKNLPYLADSRTGIGNWWQVFYVCSAIIGAMSSSLASHSIASIRGVGLLEALFGGMLMLFGSRLGSGCTSGHGLSGMGLLAWLSFLAVPAMFAGGIATAFIMRAVNNSLDRYVWETLDL